MKSLIGLNQDVIQEIAQESLLKVVLAKRIQKSMKSYIGQSMSPMIREQILANITNVLAEVGREDLIDFYTKSLVIY